jgi:hypothetical protein
MVSSYQLDGALSSLIFPQEECLSPPARRRLGGEKEGLKMDYFSVGSVPVIL